LASLGQNKSAEIKTYGKDRWPDPTEVFVGGRNLNIQMIAARLAEVYRGAPCPRIGPWGLPEGGGGSSKGLARHVAAWGKARSRRIRSTTGLIKIVF
jgi:hypothetical protein